MPSPPSWLLSWLLNEVAGCGGARTEPPNFDFVVVVAAGGWPSRVPSLPAIVHDYVTTLYVRMKTERKYPEPNRIVFYI